MKKIVLGICLLTIILSLNGCNNKDTIESINLNKQNETIDIIKEEIESMTLDEKIGQIITVGIDGYTINDKIIHVVAGSDGKYIYIITAYFPNTIKFEKDLKTRRK